MGYPCLFPLKGVLNQLELNNSKNTHLIKEVR